MDIIWNISNKLTGFLLPYVKRLSNEYFIDVFCLKASLPIKGYVSKNLVDLRGEEVFNLV